MTGVLQHIVKISFTTLSCCATLPCKIHQCPWKSTVGRAYGRTTWSKYGQFLWDCMAYRQGKNTYEFIESVSGRVNIIKRPALSKNYYASYLDNNGKDKKKSLKTTNLKQARINAQKILRSLEEHTHDIVEEVGQHKHITFRNAVDQLINRSSNAPKTVRNDKQRLDYICGDLDDQERYPRTQLAKRSMQSITAKDIGNWLADESKRCKWKSATTRQYVSVFRQVFKFAKAQNWVMNNVAADVPFPKVDDEEIPVALDDETIEKLFELLPDYAMYIMALLLETGLREGEFYNLKWKDVDTEAVEPSLVVRKTKTGSFRVVALSSRAVEIFNHMRSGLTFSKRGSATRLTHGAKLSAEQKQQYLNGIKRCPVKCFSNKRAEEYRKGFTKDRYCSHCIDLMAEFGITKDHARKLWKDRNEATSSFSWPSDANKESFIVPRMTIKNSLISASKVLGIKPTHPHQMRHTWATRLLESGMTFPELMDQGGWSTIAMVRRYAKVNVIKIAPKVREALAERTGGTIRPTQ